MAIRQTFFLGVLSIAAACSTAGTPAPRPMSRPLLIGSTNVAPIGQTRLFNKLLPGDGSQTDSGTAYAASPPPVLTPVAPAPLLPPQTAAVSTKALPPAEPPMTIDQPQMAKPIAPMVPPKPQAAPVPASPSPISVPLATVEKPAAAPIQSQSQPAQDWALAAGSAATRTPNTAPSAYSQPLDYQPW